MLAAREPNPNSCRKGWHMEISYQQAIDVLREWQQKKHLILAGIIDSLKNNALIYGVVEQLDDRLVLIDARRLSGTERSTGKAIHVAIGLENAAFSFGHWPEKPPVENPPDRYEEFLVVTFANGTRSELYVVADSEFSPLGKTLLA